MLSFIIANLKFFQVFVVADEKLLKLIFQIGGLDISLTKFFNLWAYIITIL